MNTTTEVQVVEPAPMPVAVRENPPPEVKPLITPAQAKVEAVASLTMAAYQRAATLSLTKEESDALLADFPDEAFQPGAAGKEHLLYIEHAHLRDRFTQVFGMGQWAIIPRNRWNEPFRTQRGTDGERVYVEAMLVVRGCFVGEAVGAMEYYPKNESQNYSDAVEGAKTAAFRRCAKEFGVGLQAWKKDWCEGWWARKRGKNAPGRPQTTGRVSTPPPEAKSSSQVKPEARATVSERFPTEITRQWMITQLKADEEGAVRKLVTEYFQKISALLPNETLDELPLRFVPSDKAQLALLTNKLSEFESGAEAEPAFPPHVDPGAKAAKPIEVPRDKPEDAGEPEPWRTFPMPFGKHAGTALEDLEKNYLYGLWANYTVEEEYNGKPKKQETIEKDRLFREMLDAAGDHYQFKVKE